MESVRARDTSVAASGSVGVLGAEADVFGVADALISSDEERSCPDNGVNRLRRLNPKESRLLCFTDDAGEDEVEEPEDEDVDDVEDVEVGDTLSNDAALDSGKCRCDAEWLGGNEARRRVGVAGALALSRLFSFSVVKETVTSGVELMRLGLYFTFPSSSSLSMSVPS